MTVHASRKNTTAFRALEPEKGTGLEFAMAANTSTVCLALQMINVYDFHKGN